MKKQLLIALGLATALSTPVLAESAPGWYVGAQGGVVFPTKSPTYQQSAPLGSYVIDPKTGWTGGVFVGYDFVGPRVEFEAGYRRVGVDNVDFGGASNSGSGNINAWTGLLNFMYDFDLGMKFKPYVGVGAGLARVKFSNITPVPAGVGILNDSDTDFAYQLLAGVRYDLNDNWAVRLDGRYLTIAEPTVFDSTNVKTRSEYDDISVLIGIVYKFGQAAAAPAAAAATPPAPPPPPPPAPAPAPSVNSGPFLVFFDWDRTELTPDAEKILQDAATAAKQGQAVRIDLGGHADRSGSASYNLGLSQRRADAVKAELARLGVDGSIITTKAYGETEPLVPTKDGVREPQNRRVEIVFPK